jgi:3-oxoacyl-[acyl-carrier protein] reductase
MRRRLGERRVAEEVNLVDVGTVAIVTGASQGIGKATAIRLARDFSVVVLVARSRDELERTAGEVKSAGTEAMVYALDLRDPQAAETVISGTLERFGRIDALLILPAPFRKLTASR